MKNWVLLDPKRRLLVQSQQWKQQKNVRNLFKVSNQDTRTTSIKTKQNARANFQHNEKYAQSTKIKIRKILQILQVLLFPWKIKMPTSVTFL